MSELNELETVTVVMSAWKSRGPPVSSYIFPLFLKKLDLLLVNLWIASLRWCFFHSFARLQIYWEEINQLTAIPVRQNTSTLVPSQQKMLT